VPNDVRRGAASGRATARFAHSTRRPTTVDILVEAAQVVVVALLFLARHPVLTLAMVVTAAVVENSYLRL
jgi:hypothetical protein